MSRGRSFIKPRLDEGGKGGHKIAAVALQALEDILNFIKFAAWTEGKLEGPDFRASLNKLTDGSKRAPSLHELCSTASSLFGVEWTKMLQILTDFESACEAGGTSTARAFVKALLMMRKANPGSTESRKVSGPPPSCYFDPSNIVKKSAHSISAPYYKSEVPVRIFYLVRWLGCVARLRFPGVRRSREVAQLRWFEALAADALIRLPHESNHVWEVLETTGIKFTPSLKNAIIKQVEGKISEFDKLTSTEDHWTFDQKVFDAAKKKWADKWAGRFAEELNSGAKGIVRYEKSGFYNPKEWATVDGWIRQNTIYHTHRAEKGKIIGPHEKLMIALETHCRESWYSDIRSAVIKRRREAQQLLNESSQSLLASIVYTLNVQTTREALESDLLDLGLSFTEPVMRLIFASFTKEWCATSDLEEVVFQVDPAVVVQHAASQIKAILGSPNCSEIEAFLSPPERSKIKAAFSSPERSKIKAAFSSPESSKNRKRPHE